MFQCRTQMRPTLRSNILFCSVAALGLCGCSKEDVDKLMSQAQQQVQEQVQSVQQEAQETVAKVLPTGSIHLNLNGQVQCPAAYARLLVLGEDRLNVLQVRSYSAMNYEKFPSVLFQATTQAKTIQELVGQTLEGELHIALDANNLWQSETNKPVTVSITAIEESELVGKFGSAAMLSAEGSKANLTGSFRAIFDN